MKSLSCASTILLVEHTAIQRIIAVNLTGPTAINSSDTTCSVNKTIIIIRCTYLRCYTSKRLILMLIVSNCDEWSIRNEKVKYAVCDDIEIEKYCAYRNGFDFRLERTVIVHLYILGNDTFPIFHSLYIIRQTSRKTTSSECIR